MDVIEIDKARLLFILDPLEVVKYSIYADTNEHKMEEGYQKLLSDTGALEKFKTGVLVEIFDSKDGGCEMFVTKLTGTADTFQNTKGRRTIYIFTNLSDLIGSCGMLKYTGCSGGRAYKDHTGNKYYLLLDNESPYIAEFGARKAKKGAPEYLNEHCTLLSDNAIEVLSSFA